jgi:hypothetical protein
MAHESSDLYWSDTVIRVEAAGGRDDPWRWTAKIGLSAFNSWPVGDLQPPSTRIVSTGVRLGKVGHLSLDETVRDRVDEHPTGPEP